MLGPAPVVDFDGTVVRLQVAWAALREATGVRRIDELWTRSDPGRWTTVTRAEEEAAAAAAPVDAVLRHLAAADAIAVLTSNAETSVLAFLRRYPDLHARVVAVVGRETLAGPKTNFDVFARGFRRCVEATAAARGDGPVVYVGDMQYELDFARRLGATALDVTTLDVTNLDRP